MAVGDAKPLVLEGGKKLSDYGLKARRELRPPRPLG